MNLNSANYQFVVREPYQGKVFRNYQLMSNILKPKQKIEVFSEMLDGVIVADSVSREHAFTNGSRAFVKLSKKYLKIAWHKK